MISMMQAVMNRKSRRSFTSKPVGPLDREQIENAARAAEEAGGLHIEAVFEDGGPFSAAGGKGLFHGVRNYFVLAGDKEDPDLYEKAGYYGESLVLLAERMGMGSCWVGAAYNRKKVRIILHPGEDIVCVIAFGHVKPHLSPREKVIRKSIKRKTKEIKDMLITVEQPENHIIDGVRAVVYAPSAMNRQPVRFFYENGILSAMVKRADESEMIDLGIAKFNFEAGAGRGHWNFGNGAEFID